MHKEDVDSSLKAFKRSLRTKNPSVKNLKSLNLKVLDKWNFQLN